VGRACAVKSNRAELHNLVEKNQSHDIEKSSRLERVGCFGIITKKLSEVVMKKIKITVVRKARYDDLIARYENPIENACDMSEGQIFIANGWERPEGFCLSAWETLSPFVMALSHGAENFYSGWMKNPKSAMLSCNDGFRPVSFLIETLNEEAD
jgi:uncharacterized repeat protein (TIGR04076 family)